MIATCSGTRCQGQQQSAFSLDSTQGDKREQCRKGLDHTWQNEKIKPKKIQNYADLQQCWSNLFLVANCDRTKATMNDLNFTWEGKQSQQRGCQGNLESSTRAFGYRS